jgi:hypothetical protein
MKKRENDCTARLDRLRVAADYFPKVGFNEYSDFRCLYDYSTAMKKGGKKPCYGRVCRYVDDATGMQIEGQYEPLQPWLPKSMITLVANDRTGLSRAEVDSVLFWVEGARLLLVELALDFDEGSVVDSSFVQRHLLAGKARHWRTDRAPGFDYFGTRRSPKFLRCYEKKLV